MVYYGRYSAENCQCDGKKLYPCRQIYTTPGFLQREDSGKLGLDYENGELQ